MTGCGVIVVGGSWGGMHAVGKLLGCLPADFGAPVVVVLHRGPGSSEDTLTGVLSRHGALPVCEAHDKIELLAGRVHVAPAGYHLLVERGHLALSTDPAVRFSRPSIDVALETAADAYGPRAVGVVLTGANDDGAAGLTELRRRGGVAIVQDPGTAERAAMPLAAVAAASPHAVLPVEEIPALLIALAGSAGSPAVQEVRR